MAIDITSPINNAATTHSLDDIRRLQAALQQKSFKSSAPTANMMSSTSSTITATSAHSPPYISSRPSTSYQTSPPSSSHGSISGGSGGNTTNTTTSQRRTRSDSMKTIAKYPYLSECAAQRPAVYQSPYAPGPVQGIAEVWSPIPVDQSMDNIGGVQGGGVLGVLRSRSGSLVQDFLKKQSPSQRERVQGHIRTISTEKAMLQQQEAERRRHEHQERRRRRSSKLGPVSPTFMNNSTMADTFSFSDFGPSYNYSSILQPDLSFGNNLQYPPHNDYSMPSEAEVAKPALMTHEKNSYRAFVRDLSSGTGINGHGNNLDYVHNGDPTSPLRKGMRQAGTEMLPMMQDPNHPF